MPLAILFSILVQVTCAVHCVRNGRSSLWLMVIIFLSLPGCFAYAVFEILPQYAGRREVRAAKAAAVRKLDPERDIRAAREALDTADTAANRSMLGDALANSGAWSEAALHYRVALDRSPVSDRAAQLKLARAQLESGNPGSARGLLETLPESGSPSENDRAALLLARSLDDLGETERALALYADLGERIPGAEAQCRRAALLIRAGRAAEAIPLLEEAERRARRLDRFERSKDSAMYDWAARTLAELRGG
jgi:hypothetical protein